MYVQCTMYSEREKERERERRREKTKVKEKTRTEWYLCPLTEILSWH